MSEQGSYDVCVVGAGSAGLNAAFVASGYLGTGGRLLLLDRHQRAGGMWNDAYSYVRLHQPYRLFTVGDIAWNLDRDRAYLATGAEVQGHLGHCLSVVCERCRVDARWGWEYLSHVEDAKTVTILARDPAGREHSFVAARLINASGADIEVNEPLPLTSAQVRSTTPEQLAETGLFAGGDDVPIWVIGSGKTAMDTAHRLIAARPGRRIGLIAGSGVFFFSRDELYPTGHRRWWGGTRPPAALAQGAKRYDGTNGQEVNEWAIARWGLAAVPAPAHNVFGLLSRAEVDAIKAGLDQVVQDHLVDVVDDERGPAMVLRSGACLPVAAGSWIVNCTGQFPKSHDVPHDPYVSPAGRVASVNSSSTVVVFGGAGGYFLTHLLFLGKLSAAPLYALDIQDARRRAPGDLMWVLSALMMYNLSVISEVAPPKVFLNYGLDLDRWYPLPRRLVGQVQFLTTHKRNRDRHRRTLDAFSRNTGVRCAPLTASVRT